MALLGTEKLVESTSSNIGEDTTNLLRASSKSEQGRPGEVFKLLSSDLRYGGVSRKPIRRRWNSFVAACTLLKVDVEDTRTMFPLIQTTFLRGPALVYFMEVVKKVTSTTSSAIDIVELQFLGDRAKRVNEEV